MGHKFDLNFLKRKKTVQDQGLNTPSIMKMELFGGIISSLALFLFFQNCAPNNMSFVQAPVTSALQSSSSSGTICSPFSGGSSGTATTGIAASLTYLPSNSSEVAAGGLNVGSFAAGKPDVLTVPGTFYLSEFDVPPQDFSAGFLLPSGKYLQDNQNNLLVQYFSLQAAGGIQLGGAPAGYYQLAMLSDDGGVLSVSNDSGKTYQNLVNDDGVHSNAFVCSATTIKLGASDIIPYKLSWYQGPPTRIALMVMWRYIGASNSAANVSDCEITADSRAVASDNFYFANSAGGVPTATSNYSALLAKGWSVIPASSFVLPSGQTNPCN